MLGSTAIAFFAGLGAAIWVYLKFSKRATGQDFVKTLLPAVITGVFVFFVALTILWTIF
jgi:hypothetical protein